MPLWLKITLCIISVEALGGLGGMVTTGSIDNWYAGLVKPPGDFFIEKIADLRPTRLWSGPQMRFRVFE